MMRCHPNAVFSLIGIGPTDKHRGYYREELRGMACDPVSEVEGDQLLFTSRKLLASYRHRVRKLAKTK